jgi:hypothetical protein
MSEKIEGTMVLDGLIQGRLADRDDQTSNQLKEWVGFLDRLGIRFSLQVANATFSLLPENQPVSVQPLGGQPEDSLQQALEQLAQVFPEPQRGQLFSTLRSNEYRKGEEVQTVYTIVQGAVRRHSRTVEADTTPPPVPLSTKEKVKLGAIGAAIVIASLAIAMLIPGVRAMFGDVIDVVKPFHADEIKVELGQYKKYFTLAIDEEKSNRAEWLVKLKRTSDFPQNAEHLDAAAKTVNDSVTGRLAIESLARGYVQADLFDAEDKYLGTINLRIADLQKKEAIEGRVQVPQKTKPARMVLIPQ